MDKEQIMDYIEETEERTAKQIAVACVSLLSPNQLKVLGKRFQTTIEFVIEKPKNKKKSGRSKDKDADIDEEDDFNPLSDIDLGEPLYERD